MAYLKPQTPLKDLNSGDYFYPLTTIDQVQKSDGSRVQDYDLGNVALEDSETAPGPGTPQMTTLMNMVYPVGSIYMSVNATSPASLFGGTWESLGGRFLIGQDGTYTAGSTGGEASHTLTLAEAPAHTHSRGTMNITGSIAAIGGHEFKFGPLSGAFYNNTDYGKYYSSENDINHSNRFDGLTFDASRSWTGETNSKGGGGAHNNMPPYLAVYMWKRTA